MPDSDAMTATADKAAAPAKRAAAPNDFAEIFKSIVMVAAIFLAVRVLLFQPFTIPSASMEPTLLPGDYVVISKFSYGFSRYSIPFGPPLFQGRLFARAPQRGDVVVFKLPRDNHTDYIKRLIGLPGDKIQVKGGVVLINGQPAPRDQLPSTTEEGDFGLARQVSHFLEHLPNGKSYTTSDFGPDGDMENTGVYEVPARSYFMMGDNRDNSADSRYPEALGVGFVPEENLVGKAQVILFSWNERASVFKPWTWLLDFRPRRFFNLL